MAQTTISTNPAIGRTGTWATAVGTAREFISKTAAEAITPGKYVVLTRDNDSTCEQPDATEEISGNALIAVGLGIALRDPHSTSENYAAGDTVLIAVSGEVWVTVEEAVVAGTIPFVRFSTPGSTGLGSFRSDADSAKAIGLPGSVYSSTQATAAGLAKVTLSGTPTLGA
jgi:hypothetical protein